MTAFAVFAAAGWFAWAALRPGSPTVGSTGSGTYVLSDFEVMPYVDRGTEEVDPMQAEVTFALRWSSNEYPGAHSCTLRVFDQAGAGIGSVSVEMDSMMRDTSSSMRLPVTGSTNGATATGSCGPERLDTPIAYDILDVQVMSDLMVSYVAGWPDSLGEGDYPGTNACTVALFENGDLIAQKHLTLAVGDRQEVTSTQFNRFNDQPVLVPPASLDATVACVPYVREGVFPDPKPLSDTGLEVVPSDLVGAELADALGLTPHEWSVGQTLDETSGGVSLDGQIPEDCTAELGDVVIVQQVGDGTFYCARGIDAFQAWMMGQPLIGSTPTPQDIQDQRSSEPRPRIGGWPEDVDGDGLISDSGRERIPELIAATGDGGTEGYVRLQDLASPQPADPAQAVDISGRPWIVPLFAKDGVTIVDRYILGRG